LAAVRGAVPLRVWAIEEATQIRAMAKHFLALILEGLRVKILVDQSTAKIRQRENNNNWR
jgi:hypothetical protein